MTLPATIIICAALVAFTSSVRGENLTRSDSHYDFPSNGTPPLPALSPTSSGGEGGRRPGEEAVIDFEQADVGKWTNSWTEKGVLFTLARKPEKSKAERSITFFPHIETSHKGILCAMAMEPIPVQAKFTNSATSVTLVLWGSTGCAAKLEAFDKDGHVVDTASVAVVPSRSKPGEPVPFFELSVKASEIAYIQFSGPRPGEFLAADELRFTPANGP